MKKKRLWISIGVIVILVLALIVILNLNISKQSDTIKIGAIYALTGSGATFGQESANGVNMAVNKINNEGGINGRNITLFVEDSASDPKLAVAAFNKLKDIQDVKIMLTSASTVSMALLPIAKEQGILLFADASHPNITNPSSDLIFRHADTIQTNAVIIGDFLAEKNCSSSALVYSNDDYGLVSYQEFSNKFMLIKSESFDPKITDSRTQVLKIINSNPDCVIVVGFGLAYNNIFKELKEYDYNGTIVTTMGFILSNTKSLNETVDGVYYLQFSLDKESSEYKSFVSDYTSIYGSEPAWAFTTYDDILILAEAMKKCNCDNPYKLANQIRLMKEFSSGFESLQIYNSGDIPYPTKIVRFNNY